MRLSDMVLLAALTSCVPQAEAGAPPPHGQRVEAAAAAHAQTLAAYEAGMAPLDEVCAWSVRWYRSLQQAGDPKAAQAHFARMQALATAVDGRVATGLASARDQAAMRYYVAEAAVWVAQPAP